MSKTNSENCKVTLEELIHLFQKFVVLHISLNMQSYGIYEFQYFTSVFYTSHLQTLYILRLKLFLLNNSPFSLHNSWGSSFFLLYIKILLFLLHHIISAYKVCLSAFGLLQLYYFQCQFMLYNLSQHPSILGMKDVPLSGYRVL